MPRVNKCLRKYYVLGQEGEPVLIDLGYEPGYGRKSALALYTSEDGDQQREDSSATRTPRCCP